VEVRVCPVRGSGRDVVGVVEIFSDNSRQRAVRERAKELATFAFLDPTSQIGNRRYLEQQLAYQLDQHFNSGAPLGVMLADIDEFKGINDTYGHAAGDVALLTVAKTLSNCLRASDVVGRWSGDQFLAILPGITRDALAKATEKIRKLVAKSTVPVGGSPIKATISLGAALAARGDSPQTLLKRADQHLYASKHEAQAFLPVLHAWNASALDTGNGFTGRARQPTAPTNNGTGEFDVPAVPDGADTSVDGSFVGNAPASLKLAAGKHVISVSHQGFKALTRDVSVLPGSQESLKTELEKELRTESIQLDLDWLPRPRVE